MVNAHLKPDSISGAEMNHLAESCSDDQLTEL